MNSYTPHQSKYFAEQILLQRPQSSIDGLVSAMSGVKVDLNPHQVDAALFAVKSPLSTVPCSRTRSASEKQSRQVLSLHSVGQSGEDIYC